MLEGHGDGKQDMNRSLCSPGCWQAKGGRMKRFLIALAALGAAGLVLAVSPVASAPGGSGWSASVSFTNVVASSPTTGGGYPVPPGSRVPEAGTCGPGPFNANHSESWLAVKPGTEDLVGTSKFFFDKYSTFYMFYLGAYQISGRRRRRPTTRSRATTASRPARRRCRRAGPTRPTRTSTSTPRAASTRRCCRSTRSATGRSCIRTARSMSPTATTWAATG